MSTVWHDKTGLVFPSSPTNQARRRRGHNIGHGPDHTQTPAQNRDTEVILHDKTDDRKQWHKAGQGQALPFHEPI